MLGGTSGINNTAWTRAAAAEYDAMGSFASTGGWGWAGLLPYFKKSEQVLKEPQNTYPGIPDHLAERANRNFEDIHGTTGPIKVSLEL